MPAQGAALNTDTNAKLTSGYYADRGDGTSNWHNVTRTHDGGDVTQGAKADAAVTDPTLSGSLVALLKGILTFLRVSAAGLGKAEDAAHASGDTGVMALAVRTDTAAALAGTTGDYTAVQTDALGALRTVDAVAAKVGALSNAEVTALVASKVVKASAGTLYGFAGYASAAGWVQVHNTTSAPSDGAVPVVSFPVEAGKAFSMDFGIYGRAFATGITICKSSTGPTKTSVTDMWVDAQYL